MWSIVLTLQVWVSSFGRVQAVREKERRGWLCGGKGTPAGVFTVPSRIIGKGSSPPSAFAATRKSESPSPRNRFGLLSSFAGAIQRGSFQTCLNISGRTGLGIIRPGPMFTLTMMGVAAEWLGSSGGSHRLKRTQ